MVYYVYFYIFLLFFIPSLLPFCLLYMAESDGVATSLGHHDYGLLCYSVAFCKFLRLTMFTFIFIYCFLYLICFLFASMYGFVSNEVNTSLAHRFDGLFFYSMAF